MARRSKTRAQAAERHWARFADMFQSSVIIQSIITLMLVTTVVVMTLKLQDIPKEIWGITGLILGYWFRSKSDYAVEKQIRQLSEVVKSATPTVCTDGDCECGCDE